MTVICKIVMRFYGAWLIAAIGIRGPLAIQLVGCFLLHCKID
jgi:hypothetical protein